MWNRVPSGNLLGLLASIGVILMRWTLIATSLVILSAAGMVGCQDPAAQVEEHQAAGEAYLDEQKWAEAVLEFRNVVNLDPNHAEGHHGLAKAYAGQGDARKAFWELEDTVRIDPDNVDARLQHAQLLLYGEESELDRVVEAADHVLTLEPTRWEAFVLKARAYERLERQEEALELYRLAATASTEEAMPTLLYANALRANDQPEKAETQFRSFVERAPGFAAHAALAGFLATDSAREDEAEASYRKALEVAGETEIKAGYTLLVNFLIRKQRRDEAEIELLAAIDALPEDREILYSLAQFYSAQGRVTEADEAIERATATVPNDPEPFLLLSAYRGFHGDVDGALEAAEKAVAADPSSDLAKLRRSEVLLDKGFGLQRTGDDSAGALIARARASVDAVLAKDEGNPQALFVRAKMDLAAQKLPDAIRDLRRAIDNQPEFPQAHYVLASALYVKGDRLAARSEAVRALELNANMIEARQLLARLHSELGDHELAIDVGRQILEGRPDDTGTRVIVAQSLVRQGNLDAAILELEKVPVERRTPEAHYALGRTLQYAGRSEEARKHLDLAVAADPTHPEILRALLQADVGRGVIDESAARVASALEARPEDARLQLLSGEVAMLRQDAVAAEKAFKRTLELDPNSLRGYQQLASLYVLTGRSEEVVRTYEDALEKNPRSGPIHLNLALLYELRGRIQPAIERYSSAIEINPELAVAKNNLAYLLAEHDGDLDRALDLAQDAKRQLPQNPNTADTLGWVFYKKKEPGLAIVHLREAVNSFPPGDPSLPIVRLHLGLAYEADGRSPQALEQLRAASSETDSLIEERRVDPEVGWRSELVEALARLEASS